MEVVQHHEVDAQIHGYPDPLATIALHEGVEVGGVDAVDEEQNLILVKGAIPGGKDGIVRVRMA